MNQSEIQMIIDCLPKGKTRFYYFKDRYAQMLLSYCIGSGTAVSRIKQTNYARLLSNNAIKSLVEKTGNGFLTPALLESVWPRDYECYLLTLGQWGDSSRRSRLFNQTTRTGRNLVLQLNFSHKHNGQYYRYVRPTERHPFGCDFHPIASEGYHTLAWSRLDINLESGQALIEEVQNDWIRDAVWMKGYVRSFIEKKTTRIWGNTYWSRGLECKPEDIVKYVDRVLTNHIRLWDEAMLTAAIWFLRTELGIRTIYYHTFDTGNRLKNMNYRYSRPPRSIYTTLPRKFCFEKTTDGPLWIYEKGPRRIRKKKAPIEQPKLTFWRLSL